MPYADKIVGLIVITMFQISSDLSFYDSLEEESDIGDEGDDMGWEGNQVIHVPITIAQDVEPRPPIPKPKSITVPMITTRPHAQPDTATITNQLEPDQLTVTTCLEPVAPAETVSVAILKSFDDTMTPSTERTTARAGNLQSESTTNSEGRTEDTNELDFGEHEGSSDLVVSKGPDLPKPLNNLTTRCDVTKANTELSEDELRLLSAEFRSSSEWRMLG